MSGKGTVALILLAGTATLGMWVIGMTRSFTRPDKATPKPKKTATDLLSVGELWTNGPR